MGGGFKLPVRVAESVADLTALTGSSGAPRPPPRLLHDGFLNRIPVVGGSVVATLKHQT